MNRGAAQAAAPVPAAPIGVYDSGVGGLSVLRVLRAHRPQDSFVYVADSGHAPYGDRTPDFVQDRASDVARFLLRCRAKALVLACNTVSVVAARRLRLMHSLPIIAMEPAIKPAAQRTRSKTIVVLATTATVGSRSVDRLCSLYGDGVNIFLQACPGLVEHVERGAFDAPATDELLEAYLRPGLAAGADTIVLGCTHYAFLAHRIARIAGPSVAIVEPSEAVARQLSRVLAGSPPSHSAVAGPTTFYTSGPVRSLRSFLATIGEPDADVRPLPAPAGAT